MEYFVKKYTKLVTETRNEEGGRGHHACKWWRGGNLFETKMLGERLNTLSQTQSY